MDLNNNIEFILRKVFTNTSLMGQSAMWRGSTQMERPDLSAKASVGKGGHWPDTPNERRML